MGEHRIEKGAELGDVGRLIDFGPAWWCPGRFECVLGPEGSVARTTGCGHGNNRAAESSGARGVGGGVAPGVNVIKAAVRWARSRQGINARSGPLCTPGRGAQRGRPAGRSAAALLVR